MIILTELLIVVGAVVSILVGVKQLREKKDDNNRSSEG